MSDAPRPDRQTASSLISESLTTGIGGRRGLFDTTFPTAAFLIVYIVSGSDLAISLWAAIGTGLIVVVVRLLRKESLRQVLTGFLGVAISAIFAARTGEAQNFFLPGLLLNAAYGAAFVVSILVGRPLAGYAAGALTGDITSWRENAEVRRSANLASWVWGAVFGLRLVVQLPLYFLGAVGALGVAKIVMGVPIFLLGGFLSYRIMKPAMAKLSPMVPTDEAEESSGLEAAEESEVTERPGSPTKGTRERGLEA